MRLARTSASPGGRLSETLRELAAGASLEVSPRRILGGDLRGSLSSSTKQVYLPFLPRADIAETIAACQVLAHQGFEAVPHVPARALESRDQLSETLDALRGAGAEALLLIAGDRTTAAGPFPDSLAVLESGIVEAHGFRRLAVAGHPEGHRSADVVQIDHAMRAKIEYARATATTMWVVSQFAFGSTQVIAWLERLRRKGFSLPVRVGVAGPASLRSLLSYAAYCGVEASAQLLARRPGAARLLARWSPEGLVRDLAEYRMGHPDSLLQGIHVYTFGGVQESAQWLRELQPPADPQANFRTSGVA